MSHKINRRNALTSALGIGLGFGLTSLGSAEESAEESKKPRRARKPESTVWKYVPIDPEPAAQKAYEYYKEHGCMFGLVKAAILAYADAVEPVDDADYEDED